MKYEKSKISLFDCKVEQTFCIFEKRIIRICKNGY